MGPAGVEPATNQLLISALASQLPEQADHAVSKNNTDDEIGPYTVTTFTRIQGKL
jgi:hypothetical protein